MKCLPFINKAIFNIDKSEHRLLENFTKFKDQRVLVIGDFILDAYVHGSAVRVCPEAPVPVVDTTTKKYFLGGAANAALNIATLGAKVDLCALIGNDYVGYRGYQLIKRAGIGVGGIAVMRHKKTQYKTRVMAGDQMLVRMDKGDKKQPDNNAYEFIKKFLYENIQQYDAILIADYDKGFFCPQIIETLSDLRKLHTFFLAIDAKSLPIYSKLHPDLIKPNRQEGAGLLSATTFLQFTKLFKSEHASQSPLELGDLGSLGKELYDQTAARLTALTLDQDGVLWLENGQPVHFQVAEKISTPQVSGAGDSFLAAALLCRLCNYSIKDTARIAAKAASIVILKQDTATCKLHELQTAFSNKQKVIFQINDLRQLAINAKNNHKSIVVTNGCYDLLHSGHLNFLKVSAQLGDLLIVALNIDADITKIKGPGRPINSLSERINLLSELSFVDYIIPFGGNDYPAINDIIEQLKPVLFTKGENYRYQIMKEQALLKSLHIPLVFIPTNSDKTTGKIIQKIQSNATYAS